MNVAELINDASRRISETWDYHAGALDRGSQFCGAGQSAQAINLESLTPEPLAEVNKMLDRWARTPHWYRENFEASLLISECPQPRVLDKKISSRIKEVTDTHAVIEEIWSTK